MTLVSFFTHLITAVFFIFLLTVFNTPHYLDQTDFERETGMNQKVLYFGFIAFLLIGMLSLFVLW